MEYLYEKDLRRMKLLILGSRRHHAATQEIAAILGIHIQGARKILIEQCDMLLLENLPARCDAARRKGTEIEQQLGIHLLTQATLLIPPDKGQKAVAGVMEKIERGMEREIAFEEGRAEILELIRS